jgi:hypothetical protein
VQATSDLLTSFSDVSSNYIIPGTAEVVTNHLDTGGATNSPGHYYRIRLVP